MNQLAPSCCAALVLLVVIFLEPLWGQNANDSPLVDSINNIRRLSLALDEYALVAGITDGRLHFPPALHDLVPTSISESDFITSTQGIQISYRPPNAKSSPKDILFIASSHYDTDHNYVFTMFCDGRMYMNNYCTIGKPGHKGE
jgi:hypothetical protein